MTHSTQTLYVLANDSIGRWAGPLPLVDLLRDVAPGDWEQGGRRLEILDADTGEPALDEDVALAEAALEDEAAEVDGDDTGAHCGGCGIMGPSDGDAPGWTHCTGGGPRCGDRCPDCTRPHGAGDDHA
jgi:hypothetical protein